MTPIRKTKTIYLKSLEDAEINETMSFKKCMDSPD
jgi:hypothetical protein